MISVVGGSGFIGTRFCQRLERSNTPFNILDKNTSAIYPALVERVDVRDKRSLIKHDYGATLVLLAAEHRDDVRPKSLYAEVNVEGARNICEVARDKGVNRIVFTSTVAVYGFAPTGTGEDGKISPFNEYGRTKYEAEKILCAWQKECPLKRSLVIVRPTVVFGERNRGNVYNLLRQIASGRFIMIGSGKNHKSMAYVENVAAFLEYSLSSLPGRHVYNYIDKPDFDMNTLVSKCNGLLRRRKNLTLRLPKWLGLLVGRACDIVAFVTKKKFTISSIRVKKFCADSVYSTSIEESGFTPPVTLEDALNKTLRFEFLEDNSSEPEYFTE